MNLHFVIAKVSALSLTRVSGLDQRIRIQIKSLQISIRIQLGYGNFGNNAELSFQTCNRRTNNRKMQAGLMNYASCALASFHPWVDTEETG